MESPKEKKKIGIIINELYLGGAQRLAVDEIRELEKRGFDVSLITLTKKSKRLTFDDDCSLPPEKRHQIPFTSVFDLRALRKLIAHLKKEHYDVVITHLWLANTVGRIAAWRAGVPIILSFEHNVYDTTKSQHQFFADRWLARHTTRIIAVSNAVKDSVVRHGISASDITVVPNAIRTQAFQSTTNRAHIRRALGLPDNAFLFLTIGRLEKQKAHDVLLQALTEVATGFAIIVGEGELRPYLEKMIDSLGLEGRVFLLGERNDIPDLLASVDCFVFPSRFEGVGIVMLEALAAGLPTIATDFSAAREILTDGSDALIVPVDDASALARKMQEVFESKDLRDRLSQQARISAERFSIEEHVNRLLGIIDSE